MRLLERSSSSAVTPFSTRSASTASTASSSCGRLVPGFGVANTLKRVLSTAVPS
jgi:hypothetical protein